MILLMRWQFNQTERSLQLVLPALARTFSSRLFATLVMLVQRAGRCLILTETVKQIFLFFVHLIVFGICCALVPALLPHNLVFRPTVLFPPILTAMVKPTLLFFVKAFGIG